MLNDNAVAAKGSIHLERVDHWLAKACTYEKKGNQKLANACLKKALDEEAEAA